MTSEAPRLLAVLALLLSFGVFAGGGSRPLLYAAQSGAIGLAALWGALADPAGALVAVMLAAQAALLWPALRRAAALPAPAPALTIGAGLLLVLVAVGTAPAGAVAPLAIVLLGLLGALLSAGPFGLLGVLNGAMLAMAQAPHLPLKPLMAAGLCILAVVAGGGGAMRLRR